MSSKGDNNLFSEPINLSNSISVHVFEPDIVKKVPGGLLVDL